MMLEVAGVLASLRPDLLPDSSSLWVAKIQTTRPLYLVFTKGVDYPRYVVQFGEQSPLRRLDECLTYLYHALPDLVPQSLACAPWRDEQWVHVQAGLPGVPWFRLQQNVRDLSAWLSLRTRALATLRRLQETVAGNPAWCMAVEPGVELRRQFGIAHDCGHALAETIAARVERSAMSLDALGFRTWPWQHGDYCFNNLLVSDDRLGLIDFEEFGGTSMPLHDEFSLAFSSQDFMGRLASAPSLQEQLAACIGERLARNALPGQCVEGLLFHHLLWRLNQCTSRPRRAAIALRLLRDLNDFAAAGDFTFTPHSDVS